VSGVSYIAHRSVLGLCVGGGGYSMTTMPANKQHIRKKVLREGGLGRTSGTVVSR
jgi:hypothetical protein